MRVLAIDPNVHGCGVALLEDAEVKRAVYVKHPNYVGRRYLSATLLAQQVFVEAIGPAFPKVDLLVIEHPVIYPGMPDKDLNSLLDVTAVGAAVNTALHLNVISFQTVFPAEWKGNVPKKKMLERIRSKLTPVELKRCDFTNKSDDEDLLDAVGIGLWHCGRLSTKVYPGATK